MLVKAYPKGALKTYRTFQFSRNNHQANRPVLKSYFWSLPDFYPVCRDKNSRAADFRFFNSASQTLFYFAVNLAIHPAEVNTPVEIFFFFQLALPHSHLLEPEEHPLTSPTANPLLVKNKGVNYNLFFSQRKPFSKLFEKSFKAVTQALVCTPGKKPARPQKTHKEQTQHHRLTQHRFKRISQIFCCFDHPFDGCHVRQKRYANQRRGGQCFLQDRTIRACAFIHGLRLVKNRGDAPKTT